MVQPMFESHLRCPATVQFSKYFMGKKYAGLHHLRNLVTLNLRSTWRFGCLAVWWSRDERIFLISQISGLGKVKKSSKQFQTIFKFGLRCFQFQLDRIWLQSHVVSFPYHSAKVTFCVAGMLTIRPTTCNTLKSLCSFGASILHCNPCYFSYCTYMGFTSPNHFQKLHG